nr:MAG TPA: hypothetical protein [Caudoviricetes sp.]
MCKLKLRLYKKIIPIILDEWLSGNYWKMRKFFCVQLFTIYSIYIFRCV